MAMRLSGLMSGMDTESIVQELVAVRQAKVDNTKKAQTKLSWKQDAWKSLNTRLKGLQTKYLNNMRFVSSYSKRTTKVSNSNAVSVLTGSNAVNGVHTLDIEKLAKTGYLTGGKIADKDGNKVTALSKLSDLGFEENATFTVKTGSKTTDISVTGETTISDVLNKLRESGLNANFDAKQQRFFISAKESGEANDFSITAMDAEGDAALAKLGLKTDISDDAAAMAEYVEYAGFYVEGNDAKTLENINADGRIDRDIAAKVDSYLGQYKNLMASKEATQKKIDAITEKYKDDPLGLGTVDEYTEALKTKNEEIDAQKEYMKGITDPEELKAEEEKLAAMEKEAADLTARKADAETLAAQNQAMSDLDAQIADVKKYVDITEETAEDGSVTYSATATKTLTDEVNARYLKKAAYANEVINGTGAQADADNGATKVNGQDAVIYLNGARFTSTENVFEINGLTITALAETKPGESITVTTQDDVDGIYDMVKGFLKEYNSIINEMDKLYNADTAKGYEPLTDEEKSVMSEKEVEKYEQKIKDSLLRRDSNISSVGSALKEIMSSGINVNGKKMYLADFGIETLGYFTAPENEKNAYHIYGDPDDANTSGKADVLKGMISSDSETVISFFSQLSRNLYSKMESMSKSVDGYRSYGSFYDDKKIKSDYDDYSKKIKELEAKLNAYEDKWYAKFSKMESAMAKMQKSTSALSGLLGG